MRIQSAVVTLGMVVLLSAVIPSIPADALAGPRGMIRLADMEGGDGGGRAVNLTVQQVSIQPIRAHVGDPIFVDVIIDNREDGSDTSWVELYANKKVVAKQMFRWGTPGTSRTIPVTVKWDTGKMAPGEYKIKAEVFVYQDVDPFDNEITLRQPVILVAPGGEFPGGQPAGGSATVTDERYK